MPHTSYVAALGPDFLRKVLQAVDRNAGKKVLMEQTSVRSNVLSWHFYNTYPVEYPDPPQRDKWARSILDRYAVS
jgi:hypothetical protein